MMDYTFLVPTVNNPPPVNESLPPCSDHTDFSDLPLDIPLESAADYREKVREERDAKHLRNEKQMFNIEYDSLYGKKAKTPAPVDLILQLTHADVLENAAVEAEVAAAAGAATSRTRRTKLVKPDPVERELGAARKLRPLLIAARDPFTQGDFGKVPEVCHLVICTYITGRNMAHTKAMINAIRPPLTRFHVKYIKGASALRSEACFIERYRNELFKHQLGLHRQELDQRLAKPVSFEEWQARWMRAVEAKRKRRGTLQPGQIKCSSEIRTPDPKSRLNQDVPESLNTKIEGRLLEEKEEELGDSVPSPANSSPFSSSSVQTPCSRYRVRNPSPVSGTESFESRQVTPTVLPRNIDFFENKNEESESMDVS